MAGYNDIILEKKASQFRDELRIGSTEPVDVYKVLAERNIVTSFRAMSRDFSGMAVKTGNQGFMLVNKNQTLARQHFTIGHELYHLEVQPNFTFRICNVGQFDKKDREEYNADVFSSYFLMPEAGILSVIPEEELMRGAAISLNTIVKLEQYFGVSRKALLVRLDRLKLINYNEYYGRYSSNVKKSANQLGYSVRLYEPDNDHKIIGNYGEICKNLYEAGSISESHYFNLMNDVGINIDEKYSENGDEW